MCASTPRMCLQSVLFTLLWTPLTTEKNMNESKKNFKSTVAWMSDDAVDTLDIKKIEESINSFLYFTVDAVDIKKEYLSPHFFL